MIETNGWVRIYDFSLIYNMLYDFYFAYNGIEGEEDIARDYTTTKNSDVRFKDYTYEIYSKKVISTLDQYVDKSKKVRFLFKIDVTESDIMESDSKIVLSEHADNFSRSIFNLMNFLMKRYNLNEENARDFYNVISQTSSDRDVSIRFVTDVSLGLIDDFDKDAMDQPFNVYGNIAVSRSRVKKLNKDERPIPHLEISVDPRSISEYKADFDRLWEKAMEERGLFFVDGERFDDSERLNFIRRCAERNKASAQ